MAADSKRQFATNYGRLLVFSDAARALHLENDPNVQQIIQFVTNQVLAEGLKRHYTEQYAHPRRRFRITTTRIAPSIGRLLWNASLSRTTPGLPTSPRTVSAGDGHG